MKIILDSKNNNNNNNIIESSVYSNSSNLTINYGIQILRMILSYLIVQLHCYDFKTNNKVLLFTRKVQLLYVPTFYIISFYFSYDMIKKKNIDKIKLRLQRIIMPYIVWPSIFYLINNINYLFYKNNKYLIKDLYIQLLTGKRIHGVFWFQCNLLFSFILFTIIRLLINKNTLFFIQIIGLIGNFYYYILFY